MSLMLKDLQVPGCPVLLRGLAPSCRAIEGWFSDPGYWMCHWTTLFYLPCGMGEERCRAGRLRHLLSRTMAASSYSRTCRPRPLALPYRLVLPRRRLRQRLLVRAQRQLSRISDQQARSIGSYSYSLKYLYLS